MDTSNFERLVQAHLDGTLSEADAQSLLEEVESSPERKAQLYRETCVDAVLRREKPGESIADTVMAALEANAASRNLADDVLQTIDSRSSRQKVCRRRSCTRRSHRQSPALPLLRGIGIPLAAAAAIVLLVHAVNVLSVRDTREQLLTTITLVEGTARLEHEGTTSVPQPGLRLEPGDRLMTGDDGRLVLRYSDGTTVTALSDTDLSLTGEDIELNLQRGSVLADVKPQPQSAPMRLITPHAEAVVLGTALELTAARDWSELAVKSGRVRFIRHSDRAAIEVKENQFARAGSRFDLIVRPLAKRANEILLTSDNATVTAGAWRKVHSAGESHSAQILLSRQKQADKSHQALNEYKEGRLGYAEFTFFAEGGVDYCVWIRGRCIEQDKALRPFADMVRLDAPTGAWQYANWQIDPSWDWVTKWHDLALPAPFFNGFDAHAPTGGWVWIGGPGEVDDRNAPERLTLRFETSGQQILRLYCMEGPLEIDRIWLSLTQEERPAPARSGPRR